MSFGIDYINMNNVDRILKNYFFLILTKSINLNKSERSFY